MTRTRYVAINYGIPGNVIAAQFLEYFSLLRRRGIGFEVLLLLPGNFMRMNRTRRSTIKRFLSEGQGVPLHYVPAPAMDSMLGVALQLVFLRFYCGLFLKHDATVIHARNLVSANIAKMFKGRSQRIRYIYDVRGDMIGEFKYSSAKRNAPPDLVEMETNRLMKLEGGAIHNARHVVCVSNALKELLVERYAVQRAKFSVIPCCADEEMFRYSLEKRERYRSELDLQDKVVLIYSGGMDKWHCAEEVFQLTGRVLERNEKAFFIVLTPQLEQAERLKTKYLAEHRCLVRSVAREDVAKYLLASDVGIVLRENDPVNRVASPTKIAEYLISGLPVILTEHIGDYSQFIAEQGCGCVVGLSDDGLDKQTEQALSFLGTLDDHDKQRTSDLGIEHFSKTRYIDLFKSIYEN